MTQDEICKKVQKLCRHCETRDPFRLAKAMGIVLLYCPLGTAPDCIKGFFLRERRISTITINSDLSADMQRIIAAHELGHALLHASSSLYAFHEVALFDQNSLFEKEANLFAAELLLEDRSVLECMNGDSTFFSAAAELGVPAELLDFKLRLLKRKGFQITESPLPVRNNFLLGLTVDGH